MPLKNVRGFIFARRPTAAGYVRHVWTINPTMTTMEYRAKVTRIPAPNSPTIDAIKAKTPYGASFMMMCTIWIIASLIPSKKERTDLAFVDGIMVNAMPRSNAKKII